MPAMATKFIIHDRAHAEAALAAAAETGRAVVLVSPPGAAAYMGAAYFRELVAGAARAAPEAEYAAVLDCGNDAALALNALRHGLDRVALNTPSEVMEKVADIARQMGAELIPSPVSAYDLEGTEDPRSACRKLLDG